MRLPAYVYACMSINFACVDTCMSAEKQEKEAGHPTMCGRYGAAEKRYFWLHVVPKRPVVAFLKCLYIIRDVIWVCGRFAHNFDLGTGFFND